MPFLSKSAQMRLFALLCSLVAFLLIYHGVLLWPARAETASPTVIDVGANVSALMAWARDILVTIASLVVAAVVPLPLRVFVTNNMLERAVDYAIAQVDGAAKGKVLDVTTANEVLNEAIAYVITMGPSMAKRLGDNLRPMLLARLAKMTPLTAASIDVPVAVPPDPAGR